MESAHESTQFSQSSVDLRSAIRPTEDIPQQRFVGVREPSHDEFTPISNYGGNSPETHAKPDGGFWTAPQTDTGNTYSDYIQDQLLQNAHAWDIEFAPGTTVLYVDSKHILHSLPQYNPGDCRVIDFEKLFDTYDVDGLYIEDGIAFAYSRKHFPISLYFWDVESCVWNSFDCITNTRYCGSLNKIRSYGNDTTTQTTL